MKILGRVILAPWYVTFGTVGRSYGNDLDYPIFLKIGKYAIGVMNLSRMSGTCDTTTFTMHSIKYTFDKDAQERRKKTKEFSFMWRPDVTWEHFNRDSYFAHKRKLYEKKYGPLKKSGDNSLTPQKVENK